MDENSKKEEFSYGYIHLLASVCGFITNQAQRAEDNFLGIDLHIIDSQSLDNGQAPRIFAQVKCTTPKYFYESKNCFKYDLKARNYNQLVKKSIDPNILIVLVVAEDLTKWITVCEDKHESLIKGAAYWVSLEGMEKTENTQVRIEIPKDNLLTPATLQRIMEDSLERRIRLFQILDDTD